MSLQPTIPSTSAAAASATILLHYSLYPRIVEEILAYLPRQTLIPLRLSCRTVRNVIDDMLAEGICISPNQHDQVGVSELNQHRIQDLERRRIPALFPLCGIASLPPPHIFNDPHIWFAVGRREQTQAAHRALTRVAKSVRYMRLCTYQVGCPLLVPLVRLMTPLMILQVAVSPSNRRHHDPDAANPIAVPSHTVVVGTPTFILNRNPGQVCYSDPGARYTSSLRKVVYNCDHGMVIHVEKVLKPDYSSSDISFRRGQGAPRPDDNWIHSLWLNSRVEFVFIFHPLPRSACNLQRAIICKALQLARSHYVDILFVNADVLPSSTFPFDPSDPVLGLDDASSLPDTAVYTGSALQSFKELARTCASSDSVAFCTMDEYRQRVGQGRFEKETFADGNHPVLQRERYQRLWEVAKARGEDAFDDDEIVDRPLARFGYDSFMFTLTAPTQANPAPLLPTLLSAELFTGFAASAFATSAQVTPGPESAPARAQAAANPASGPANPLPVMVPAPSNAEGRATSQPRPSPLHFRSAFLERIINEQAGVVPPHGAPPDYQLGQSVATPVPVDAVSVTTPTVSVPANTVPSPTAPAPDCALAHGTGTNRPDAFSHGTCANQHSVCPSNRRSSTSAPSVSALVAMLASVDLAEALVQARASISGTPKSTRR